MVYFRVVLLMFVIGALAGPRPAEAVGITVGETTITPTNDGGNANLLIAQPATLSQTAIIQSLSFYVTTASGNLRLGIYDATGPGGGPGAKRAETNSFVPLVGWNTANVISPVSLSPGTYWLAYLPSSNSLGFKVMNGGTVVSKLYSYTFGVMPVTFSSSPSNCGCHWSFYATLNTGSGVVDTTPPSTPRGLSAAATSSSQINLSWIASTDNLGVTGYKIFRNSMQVATSTTNSYSDTGLTASTAYTYTVSSNDAAGNNSANSTPASATTLAASFSFSISNGGNTSVAQSSFATNSITTTLSAGATAPVTFTVAGLPTGVTGSFNPASCSPTCTTTLTLNAAASARLRTSTISVSATGGGATHTTSFSVTVTNAPDTTPPTVSMSAPANGATVAGTSVAVSATANDNVGVAGVQFLLDGVNLNAEDTTFPYSTSWNTTTASNGRHILSARARDVAGNTATATNISVTVDNQPPTGTIVINGGAAVTNSTAATLTLSATDTQGAVTQMRFSNTGSSYSTPVAYATTAGWILSTGDGTKTVYVEFGDSAGNWSTGITSTILLDTTPPTISAVSAVNVTNNSATIQWATNEPATSEVEYGLTTSYGTLTPIDNSLVISHSVTVSGLTAQTKYNYRVRSKDAATNEAIGSNSIFTSLSGPPDTTPPTVPTNLGANPIADTQISLSWTASTDNVAVAGYKVFRNGNQVATVTSGTTYTDTLLLPKTAYSYRVSAYDAVGNTSTLTAPVPATTLPDTTPPTVSIISPANNSTISGIVPVVGNASDDVGIASVTLQVDGINVVPTVTAPPYTVSLDTKTLSDGSHSLTMAGADTSNNAANSAPVSVTVNNSNPLPPGTPTMIQHLSTASNYDESELGNPYFISLPNATGAGNALILGVSYPFAAGRTVSVSDDMSNTWKLGSTTPSNPADGQMVSSLYYALGVVSGTQKIKITFDGLLFNFQAVVSEFYNVAGVAAFDGSSGNAASSVPTVTAGSFTTASAGDLVYSYAFNTNVTDSVTGFAAGSGFTLLSADIERGSVAQYAVQASAGAINPTVTVAGGADPFNAVALALKAATTGTPPAPGIRIVHVYHVLYSRAIPLQFPSTGNLLVCVTAFGTGEVDVSALSTNPVNIWTNAPVVQPASLPQIWYAANASTSPNLRITPTTSPVVSPQAWHITLVIYDVTGAADSPYDAAAGLPWQQQSNTNNSNLLNMPVITPSTTNELIFAVMSDGIGPTVGMVGPGLTLDTITYGNEIDSDAMDNADGYAHYNSSTVGPVSFGWIMNSSSVPETSTGVAIAFRSATPSQAQNMENSTQFDPSILPVARVERFGPRVVPFLIPPLFP